MNQQTVDVIKAEMALIALQYHKLQVALDNNDMHDIATASFNIKGCAEGINKLVNNGGIQNG